MIKFKDFLIELRNPPEVHKFKSIISRNTWISDDEKDKYLTPYMQQYDFHPLGTGFYASVYGNSKYPFVIKVFTDASGYKDWYNFCKRNQKNKYVPKIKGSIVWLNPSKNIAAVRLEKLIPTKTSFYALHPKSTTAKNLSDEEKVYLLQVSKTPIIDKRLKENLKKNDKDLWDIFDWLRTGKYNIDLHRENVMYRTNGQLVITDPIS